MDNAKTGVDLHLIDLVTADMDATVAFYRALGVTIPETAIWKTESGRHHVDLTMPGGMTIHFDSPALAKVYNKGYRKPTGTGRGSSSASGSRHATTSIARIGS